jgi:SAM-dependent methyltransferase
MTSYKNPAKKAVYAILRWSGLKSAYQDKRGFSLEERWALIFPLISPKDKTVVDIGCNLGDFTARFAQRNMFAVGLDAVPTIVRAAVKRNLGINNLAFGTSRLSPQNIDQLPPFDVTLCLSVAHNWHRDYGEDQCWSMIEKLISRSKTFILETASVGTKYGASPPEFFDNDEKSIKDYFLKHLALVAKPEAFVGYVGKSACIGREPYRYLFAVRKQLKDQTN